MRTTATLALLALLASIGASQEHEAAVWKWDIIAFEAHAKNHRAPFVSEFWTFDGSLYLNVNYVDGHEFGRYVDDKLERIPFPASAGLDPSVEVMLDIGGNAFIATVSSDKDAVIRSAFLLKADKLSEIEFVGDLFLAETLTMLSAAPVPVFAAKGRRANYVYVLNTKEQKLVQVTMPDGKAANFSRHSLLQDASGRWIGASVEEGAEFHTQYVLMGTAFEATPAPLFPDGAKKSSYQRRFANDGALACCTVDDKWHFWFERDGKREEVLDAAGKKLEFERPFLQSAGGHLYLYGSRPEPGAYLIQGGKPASPLRMPKGETLKAPSISTHAGVAFLWNLESDYDVCGAPYRLEGDDCQRLLNQPGAMISSRITRIGDCWVTAGHKVDDGYEVCLVRDGEVTRLSMPPGLYPLTGLAVDEPWRPSIVGDTVFICLEDGGRNNYVLCRQEGSKLVPVQVPGWEDQTQRAVKSRWLKVSAIGDTLYVRESAGAPATMRRFQQRR